MRTFEQIRDEYDAPWRAPSEIEPFSPEDFRRDAQRAVTAQGEMLRLPEWTIEQAHFSCRLSRDLRRAEEAAQRDKFNLWEGIVV